MRVAYLSPCWPYDRTPNGIATYVAGVRRGVEAEGVEAWVLSGDVDEDIADERVLRLSEDSGALSWMDRLRVRWAGLGPQSNWVRALGAARTAPVLTALDEAVGLDLFEMEESYGIVGPIARRFRKPVVVRLHGPHCVVGEALGHERDRLFQARVRAEGQGIAAAAAISSPATDALEQVRRAYGLPFEQARVIPNPVEIPDPQQVWRRDEAEPDTILFVGRFDRVKGADVLLEAFAQLLARRPTLRLVFVGPDAGLIRGAETLSFSSYLDRFVPAEARERIEWTGPLPAEAVRERRRKAAVTVVSSRYETFSMVAAEAMALGCPLVVADRGGLRDVATDEETALFFEGEAPASLAARVEQLLENPDRAAQLGEAARRDALARFSLEVVGRETRRFYEEILAGVSRRA